MSNLRVNMMVDVVALEIVSSFARLCRAFFGDVNANIVERKFCAASVRLYTVLHRLILSMVLGMGIPAWAEMPQDSQLYFFDQTLGDFDEELELAREEGKTGIMLFFEMDECPFCHRMKETVFNQPEVQAYFKEHFLIFPVDIEGDVTITDFEGNRLKQKNFAFRDYRVRATPVLMFFDLDGKPVARYTGATADAQEFMWLGQYVVDGIYKDMPFTRYKRERRQSSH